MDSIDEEFYGSTSFTTKGRRTKRQRTTNTTTTATTSYRGSENNDTYFETSYGSSASATPSPSSTPDNENDVVSELTTEEEETANCLILLSNGGKTRRRRRSTAAAAAAGGSSGGGVYECKTCNRTFPSFQALGGHRTSHKKIVKSPKIDNEIVNHDSVPVTPPRKTTTGTGGGHRSSGTAAEVAVTVVRAHVCAICGSEFPSGQALGGHMRRHRPAVCAAPPESHPIIIQETLMLTSTGGSGIESGGGRNILPLDLNLPAPSDDHDQVVVVDSSHMVDTTKFHVLPSPALLDCHY